ncbi:hypothetical protein F511_29178 [Dorcoceras hygrometricum]|uniref:Uncharacterized protein n=1 Tax=Dorcoceras hygrometricum TaxID=472368 RepID=A0A2Z7BPD7_9LAMI|nr:hypothetical protein F511_29178 [Dorcoceras hygrometricum]
MNGAVISNIHLAVADGVLSVSRNKIDKSCLGYSDKDVRGQVTSQQDFPKEKVVYSSDGGIFISDRPYQHSEYSIFLAHLIGAYDRGKRTCGASTSESSGFI